VWEKAGNSGAKDRIERAEWIYNRHNALKKLCLKYYRVILLADLFTQPKPGGTASYLTKFQSASTGIKTPLVV
jgi:hypothetical protein